MLALYILTVSNHNTNMLIGEKDLDEVLRALDRHIGLEEAGPIALVVIGGAALHALGLVKRTTKDVDVLGEAEDCGGIIGVRKMNAFPEFLKRAAHWILTQDVSEPFRILVKDFLKQHGYEQVAERI